MEPSPDEDTSAEDSRFIMNMNSWSSSRGMNMPLICLYVNMCESKRFSSSCLTAASIYAPPEITPYILYSNTPPIFKAPAACCGLNYGYLNKLYT